MQKEIELTIKNNKFLSTGFLQQSCSGMDSLPNFIGIIRTVINLLNMVIALLTWVYNSILKIYKNSDGYQCTLNGSTSCQQKSHSYSDTGATRVFANKAQSHNIFSSSQQQNPSHSDKGATGGFVDKTQMQRNKSFKYSKGPSDGIRWKPNKENCKSNERYPRKQNHNYAAGPSRNNNHHLKFRERRINNYQQEHTFRKRHHESPLQNRNRIEGLQNYSEIRRGNPQYSHTNNTATRVEYSQMIPYKSIIPKENYWNDCLNQVQMRNDPETININGSIYEKKKAARAYTIQVCASNEQEERQSFLDNLNIRRKRSNLVVIN